MSRFVQPIEHLGLVLILLGICLAIATGDALMGRQISPWALYLVPIAFAGWAAGRSLAVTFALLSTCLIVAVGLLTGHPFASNFYFLLAVGNRLVCLLVVAILAAENARLETLKSVVRSYEEAF